MFFRRILVDALRDPASAGKVRLLFGARQTGKTALLRHLLAGPETAVWNLQDVRLRLRLEAEPWQFSAEVRALPPYVRNVLVDEVQKVPALLEEVQLLHDEEPGRRQFFLTGSSARRLRATSANLLPGRSHNFHLFPVLRWETDADLDEGWPWSRPRPDGGVAPTAPPPFPEAPLARLLVLGSLPGVLLEPEATAARTLESYVENYLEEEVRRETAVRDVGAFSTFLRLAAVESGRTVNLAALSKESGVPASTLRNFYDVLADTFVGHALLPYARPGRKKLLTTPRFFLFDTGVRNAAAGLPLDARILETEGGPLLEHWTVLELHARAATLGRTHRVSSWRTRSGAEVDLVFESPDEDVPVEVKWTTNPHPQDARHLETFLDAYPTRAHRGVVVCRCDRPRQLTERVLALPWDRL